MRFLVETAKCVLRALYALIKAVCPQQPNRVVFLSRQSNEPQLDFLMLIERLERECSGVRCTCICCRSDRDLRSRVRYLGAFLYSMVCLARSRVCVLNSYWPAVSILNHRGSLKVIQIWHALGKIKQSGYQTLDRDMGHSSAMAQELAMHKGYDIVIAGAKAWNPMYCASFGIENDVIRNVGLPRLDFLQTQGDAVRKRFFEKYPHLKGRRIVLYAPTFRPGVKRGAARLFEELTKAGSVVLFKHHPNQPMKIDDPAVLSAPDFTSLELLLVCDYLVTDYSAIAIEAASVHVKTYYYCFDIEAYREKNGLNIDLEQLLPHCVYRDAGEIARAMEGPYPIDEFEAYRARYVLPDKDLGKSTERIVDMIREGLDPC